MKNKFKILSNQITIVWYFPRGENIDPFNSYSCIYKNGELVSSCNFPLDTTLETVERFLELSSDWQKLPGHTDCPCKQEQTSILEIRGK